MPFKYCRIVYINMIPLLLQVDVEKLTIRYKPGGHSIVKNTGGGWLDSLRSGILVGKLYFGVLQKN